MEPDDIQEVYEKVKDKLSYDEFLAAVDAKHEEMGGICTRHAAALLVAHGMGVPDTTKIKNITAESGNVCFSGKVVSVSDVREFSRADGSGGRVANIVVGDETGSVRVALWDDIADLVKIGDIKPGHNLMVKGFAKAGLRGVEINVGRSGGVEHIAGDVKIDIQTRKIDAIKGGLSGVSVTGKLLDAGSVRQFKRKDGSAGNVRNISIGDETGKIRVVLWEPHAAMELAAGTAYDIINAYTKENTFSGQVELHVGNQGQVRKSDRQVSYSETMTHIADVEANGAYSVEGHVTGLEQPREFERSDGTKSKVANIYISDDTGRVRVALWGDHADIVGEIDIGSRIQIIDCYAKSGRNSEIELSVGARSRVRVLSR